MGIKVDPEWWKKIFDEVYLLTDARSVCNPNITNREVDLVCELLDLKANDKILDLCGGHGRHSLELCARGINDCTLIDYSDSLINYAMKSAAKAGARMTIIQADARKTELPSGCFDHVLIMGNSLGYIQDANADLQILKEAIRVLCSGGKVLVDVANGCAIRKSFKPNAWHEIGEDFVVCRQREIMGNRVNAREMVISKKNGLIRDHTYSIQLYEPESFCELLRKAGFTNIAIQTDFSPHSLKGDYGCMNNRMIGIGVKP